MGRGYAEGPAVDAAEEERERLARGPEPARPTPRTALFGATREDASPHFLGWADELDADALFAAGTAWGISRREIATASVDR